MPRKTLLIILMGLLLFTSGFHPDSVKARDHTVIIGASDLNVREGPGLGFPTISKVNEGEIYQVANKQGDWIEIYFSNSQKGWVSSDYVQFNQSNHNKTTATSTKAIATASLNVRNSPSLQGEIIGRLSKGEQITLETKNQEWAQFNYEGTMAWVSTEFLKLLERSEIVNTNLNIGQATVTAASVNIRDRASLEGSIIGSVKKGETYQIIEQDSNWLKIEFTPGVTGWAASQYFSENPVHERKAPKNIQETITVLNDGTNIRDAAGTFGNILKKANSGETFRVVDFDGDWYVIELSNGTKGYIANWVVSTKGSKKTGNGGTIKDKTIVIDPGHGGKDVGTIGIRGTYEKTVTLSTATKLYNRLKAAGANVIITRHTDTYLSLAQRVATSRNRDTDAFISIHYDSTDDKSVRGMTSYYYHDDSLAEKLHSTVINKTDLTDRGVRFGDYYVIRENLQNSVLLELGYLSNSAEEMLVTTEHYQQTVADGIYEGLVNFFNQH